MNLNTSCEFIMDDCITTTKQSTTKPCAYFLGYSVKHETIPKHTAMPLMLHLLPCGNIERQSNDFEMTVYFDLFCNKCIMNIYTSPVNFMLQVDNNDTNVTLETRYSTWNTRHRLTNSLFSKLALWCNTYIITHTHAHTQIYVTI